MGAVVSHFFAQPCAIYPELLTHVPRVIQRMITTQLIDQAGIEQSNAATGAVTLIQRFGSATNLNIHLHELWLVGVYEAAGEGDDRRGLE